MHPRQRSLVGLLVAVITATLVWWTSGDGGSPATDPETRSSPTVRVESPSATASPTHDLTATTTPSTEPSLPLPAGGTDPGSGLPVVPVGALPPEAGRTLELIDAGGPFPEEQDGTTFHNREEILPDRPLGYYAEYTVPTPGSPDRGARRIVAGDGGEYYWTKDHYRSFEVIAR